MPTKLQTHRCQIFLMKKVLNTQNIDIMYCPAGEMLANFKTKPSQGNLFQNFRDAMTGFTLKRETILVD